LNLVSFAALFFFLANTSPQMAGFHPDWRYGEGSGNPAIDWEKRSPYPTISLVLTAGLSGESATEKIAAANTETLSALGSEKAAALFQEAIQQGSDN
jgi:hypothetical protein